MRIIGHGIDQVGVERVARSIAEHGERFLERVYTAGELAYARGSRREQEHLAARFAAKEAVLKALGTGWSRGIAWTDVEVVSLASGQPTVRLHGQAALVAAELGVTAWVLALTHTSEWALASAIASGE